MNSFPLASLIDAKINKMNVSERSKIKESHHILHEEHVEKSVHVEFCKKNTC